MSCYPFLDHPAGRHLAVADRGGSCAADRFTSDIGTLLPIALCGRKAARCLRGLSVKQVARSEGVDEVSWARWERGGRVASSRHAAAANSFVSPFYNLNALTASASV